MTVETRYKRSDTQTVNGLLAYQLGTAQSASALSVANSGASQSLSATLRPTSDVSKGFPESYPVETPVDQHWSDVDDVVADDMSSYIVTGESATEVYDRYGKASYSLPSGYKIGLVRVTCRGLTEYTSATAKQASFRFGVYIGTAYYLSAYQKTDNAWATRTLDLVRNPATGLAWTEADINNMNIAVSGKSYYDVDWQIAYITQVYVEIYVYADASVYYAIDVLKRDSGGTETTLESKVAEVNSLISALYDSPGLKNASFLISSHALASTDSIVVKLYQKIGAGGTYNLVRTWTTGQLGAQSLDATSWTVYYYLDVSADASYVYTVYWHGTTTYNSRIENFTWTPAVVAVKKPIMSIIPLMRGMNLG